MSSKQKRKICLFFFFQKSIKFSRVSKLKPFILPCICDLPSPSPFNHAISSFHLKYHCLWSWLVNYFSLKMLSVKLLPGDSISVSDRKKKRDSISVTCSGRDTLYLTKGMLLFIVLTLLFGVWLQASPQAFLHVPMWVLHLQHCCPSYMGNSQEGFLCDDVSSCSHCYPNWVLIHIKVSFQFYV